MPRTARVCVVNALHHVYQPSVRNKKIFYTDQDREMYLQCLKEKAEQFDLDVVAYCLMPTYIHLLVIPRKKDSLSKAVGRAHFSYAKYLSGKRKLKTSIWRNRFQSCALDAKYARLAAKYVECQPVYAKMVRKPEKFAFSSAKAHITGKDPSGVLSKVWPSPALRKKWAAHLKDKLPEDMQELIRTYTQTGRPLGAPEFVKKLEQKFRRRLHPLPVGRPPKKKKVKAKAKTKKKTRKKK